MPSDFPLFGPSPPLAAHDWVDRQGHSRAIWVALIAVTVAWLPAAILAAVDGRLGSFLTDPAPQARLLVSLPLLLLTPLAVDPGLSEVRRQFIQAELVRPEDREAYAALVAQTLRLRRWWPAVLVCVALALAAAVGAAEAARLAQPPAGSGDWRAGGTSPAALWNAVVARPLHFLVLAFVAWRLCLWWRFLWKVSRLPLRLAPGHPDGAAGLGFLVAALRAFQLPAFAIAAAPAGTLAALILADKASLTDHLYTLGALAAVIVGLFAAPLLVFTPALLKARRLGELAYAALAQRQLRRFEAKWLAPTDELDPLDAPDFSAVIDLDSVVATALKVRLYPAPNLALVRLTAAALAPFVPVAALQIPLKQAAIEAVKLLL